MKKIKYILLIFISLITINTIYAESSLISYSNNLNTNEYTNILDIVGNKEYYYLITEDYSNTIIYKYNYNNDLISTKEFSNLISSKIIKFNNNYLLVGKQSNTLKTYYIDSNLRILSQNDSSLIISPNTDINLYNNDNKVYVMLTNNNLLYDNNLYEIDEELNVTSNNLSSYNTDNLINILTSDYYLIHNNDTFYNDKLVHYYNSLHTKESNILIGGTDNKAIITIINSEETKTLEYDEYINFYDIALINNQYLVAAIDSNSLYYLLTINYDGHITNKEQITSPLEGIYKVGNKLSLLTENTLEFYDYKINIKINDTDYATTNVVSIASPYENVSLNILPNSGYEVAEIIIKDEQGQIISLNNNEFTTLENDINIEVTYKETINNPETIDYIIIFISLLVIVIILNLILKKKLSWLR